MTFANPWGLLALLAVPAIVVIHLYHRRFPPLRVAGLHLWTSETRQPLAGRTRERLLISTSLILEVLAAILLSLVLAQPRLGSWDQVAHLVVVLDDTASMSAKPPGRPSFRDQAVTHLTRRVEALPRGSVVTLLLTGTRPEALGHALPWTEVKPRLAKWQPSAVRHAFDPAWDTALQVAESSGQVLFFTNRPLPEGQVPSALEVVAIGEPLENVAISAARWTYDTASKEGRLFLRVQNHGVNPTTARIRGLHQGKPLFNREVSLAANAGSNFESALPGGLGQITVEAAGTEDGLGIDSRVELVEPHPRIMTVANTLPQAHAARDSVQKILAVLPELQAGSGNEAHLVIATANPLPESNARLWWLGIGPLSTTEADRQAAKDLKGPFILEKRNPLLEGVELAGAIWGGVQPLTSGTPLISSGSSRLLVQLPGTQTTAFVMNVDFARSNLAESPDWPILLSNLVEQRRNALPGLQRWNYRLGEDVRFRLTEGDPESTAPLSLEFEGQQRPLARTAEIEISAPSRPGLYTLRDGEKEVERFAVGYFDAETSNLRTLRSYHRPAKTAESTQVTVDARYTWAILMGLLVLLGVVLADWWVLARK